MNKSNNKEITDNLDALIAAPYNHTLILENEKVRVLDTLIRPGDSTPVHTHTCPSVFYIISWSDEGNVLVDTRKRENGDAPPSVLWSEPLGPHSVENVGDAELHVIGIEIK
jgi:mannose-6-phosphate isomerase-like protein (cupin superfamily)